MFSFNLESLRTPNRTAPPIAPPKISFRRFDSVSCCLWASLIWFNRSSRISRCFSTFILSARSVTSLSSLWITSSVAFLLISAACCSNISSSGLSCVSPISSFRATTSAICSRVSLIFSAREHFWINCSIAWSLERFISSISLVSSGSMISRNPRSHRYVSRAVYVFDTPLQGFLLIATWSFLMRSAIFFPSITSPRTFFLQGNRLKSAARDEAIFAYTSSCESRNRFESSTWGMFLTLMRSRGNNLPIAFPMLLLSLTILFWISLCRVFPGEGGSASRKITNNPGYELTLCTSSSQNSSLNRDARYKNFTL